ncbi:MAG: hypothetical protein ACE5GD_05015 [Candidatus Geothermarchaeales archaeon]
MKLKHVLILISVLAIFLAVLILTSPTSLEDSKKFIQVMVSYTPAPALKGYLTIAVDREKDTVFKFTGRVGYDNIGCPDEPVTLYVDDEPYGDPQPFGTLLTDSNGYYELVFFTDTPGTYKCHTKSYVPPLAEGVISEPIYVTVTELKAYHP